MKRKIDLPLLALTSLLVALGLVFVYSASSYGDARKGNSFAHLEKQGLACIIGFMVLALLARTPYRRLIRYVKHMYVGVVGMLVLVFVPGVSKTVNGATRWIELGPVNLQPAEMVKMVVVIGMSWWMSRNRGNVNDQQVLVPAGVAMALPLGLIIVQPDFGSFAIICGLAGLVLFLAGLNWRWVAMLAGVGAVGLGIVGMAKAYRVARVTSFLDPFEDCSGAGYQVCQSLLAFHHGGIAGQGLGGSYAKLSFLPEPHNDFIAAVVGEETGLVGMLVLVSLYALFAWRGVTIARRAPDMFGALLATAFTVMIAGQACLNLGVALALVPPKGLVLPFMSYGASAMVVNLAAVGVLLSVSAEAHATATEPDRAALGAGARTAVGA
jgi:cell division protein FtsW